MRTLLLASLLALPAALDAAMAWASGGATARAIP